MGLLKEIFTTPVVVEEGDKVQFCDARPMTPAEQEEAKKILAELRAQGKLPMPTDGDGSASAD